MLTFIRGYWNYSPNILTLCEKKLFKPQLGRIPIDPGILAAIGTSFHSKSFHSRSEARAETRNWGRHFFRQHLKQNYFWGRLTLSRELHQVSFTVKCYHFAYFEFITNSSIMYMYLTSYACKYMELHKVAPTFQQFQIYTPQRIQNHN